jgi:hypothetical protein
MPLYYNLQIEIFDVGPFLKSHDYEYILVAVDYVSKWVEAMACRATDTKHDRKMFHEIIFPRFDTPRMVISDGGSHFIDKTLRYFLKELGAKHNIATPIILKQVDRPRPQINRSRTSYRRRSMTWGKAGRISFLMHFGHTGHLTKPPISMSPYQLVYGKSCHLSVELEHRAHRAIKSWNMDVKLSSKNKQKQIAELEEWREKAY